MWLLFTCLLGPESDRRYGFGGRNSRSYRGGGSWWRGYDFDPPPAEWEWWAEMEHRRGAGWFG